MNSVSFLFSEFTLTSITLSSPNKFENLCYCHYHTDAIEPTLLSNLSIGVFDLGGALARKFSSSVSAPSARAVLDMFKYACLLVLEHPNVKDPNNLDPLMKDILLSGKYLMQSGGGVITMGQITNTNHGVGKKLIELASFVVAADNWGYYPKLSIFLYYPTYRSHETWLGNDNMISLAILS